MTHSHHQGTYGVDRVLAVWPDTSLCTSRPTGRLFTTMSATNPTVHHCSRSTGRLFNIQSAAHPAVHHCARPTGFLYTAQQPFSPSALSTAGEGSVTYTN